VEDKIMKAICARYGMDYSSLHLIKATDLFVQEVEYNSFYRKGRITYMNPERAKHEFLDRFKIYYDEK
jgi:hypothetical protein